MSDFENDIDEYDPNAFDIESFRGVVGSHWNYLGLCNSMNWSVDKRDDDVWQIGFAPPFQIVYGGAEDGKKVWTPFEFDIIRFLNEPDVEEVIDCGVVTHNLKDDELPFIGIVGKYRGKQFAMRISMEPEPQTEPFEIVDTIQHIVRPITGEHS